MDHSTVHSQQDRPALKPGDVVAGRFRIVETIGSGGFSVVYRAHQQGMNRFVALKVLKPSASTDDSIVERFRREALFASQLSHPNTITLFDYGQTEEGLCYIAMEYLVGHDLSEELLYREPVEPKRVWSILTQTCRSLAEAHRIGLIHRDLKPENIFIANPEGREFVKVLDFGVSKALSEFNAPDVSSLAPLTQEGTVFGTPLYMAPEQALAEELTPAVDVYALGHLGYEMLTGTARYAGETSAMDVMLRQIDDPPLRLPAPWDDTPFDTLLHEATRKDSARRIPDAATMLEVLMDEAFVPYMDADELPNPSPSSGEHRPSLQLPVGSEAGEHQDSETVYRWELSVLDEALEEVGETAEMRLMVLRGNPGSGRSNLLRAFLKRHRNEAGLRIVHRQAFVDGPNGEAGLEADLAEAAGLQLQGRGVSEIHRLLNESLAATEGADVETITPLHVDSDPLSRLASQRDDFFTRLVEPFRRAARVGTLVWGIENLESVDPLTVAFLERFIREMRVHPAPVFLVVTVHPDSLVRRPGLMRYAEEIIHAPSTYARHLRLADPEERPDEESADEEVFTQLAELSSDASVEGSYHGISPSVPSDLADEKEVDRWAALADGEPPEAASQPAADPQSDTQPPDRPEQPGEPTPGADHRVEPDHPNRPGPTTGSGPTEKLELFTTEETATGDFDEAAPELQDAFDVVLGYLAQLDERVVPRRLWEFVYPRVLPFETTRMMKAVLEYAERYGILKLSEQAIAFTSAEFATTLRENFDETTDATEAHAELAELLQQFTPQPDRDDVRRIVHHAVKGEDYGCAVELLLRCADRAYDERDLDLAREYYLQFQELIDELSADSPPPDVARQPYPKQWLRIGEIQGAVGEHGAAEDALHRAIRESDSEDHRIRAAAHKLLGDLAMSQRRYEYARECFDAAGELYKQTSLARPYVASLAEIGHCFVLLGKPRPAEGTLMTALQKAEKLQDRALMGRIHRYLGEVLTRQARFLEAVDHLEEAMALFERQSEFRDVIASLLRLGRAFFAAGEFERSRDLYTRALARLSTRHFQLEQSPHLGLARALAALNNLEQAEVHLVEAMSHYTTRNQPAHRAQVQFHLGDLYLAKGRPQMADEHFEHVFEVGERVGHRRLAFDALVRRGYAMFDAGDTDACLSLLAEAADFAEESGNQRASLVARAHIIYVQLLMTHFQAQGALFSGLLTEVNSGEHREVEVLCELFRADVAACRGALNEASSLLSTARERVAGLGEYTMFIPIARREYVIGQQIDRLEDPHAGAGFALGSPVPPEAGTRRFDDRWVR